MYAFLIRAQLLAVGERRCASRFGLALLGLLCGCTYVCHNYTVLPPDAGENVEVSSIGFIDSWEIFAEVKRQRGTNRSYPKRGSWPHWPPAEDDEYRLVVKPVAADSTAWQGIEMVLGPADVDLGDGRTLEVAWAAVEDGRTQPIVGLDWYREYRRTRAPLSFISDAFHLPTPPPRRFLITFEIVVLDSSSRSPLHRMTFHAVARALRHRRWTIMDAVES